jgi:triacylglycerol lipase
MDDVIDSDLDAAGFSVQTGYYLACASLSAYADGGGGVEQLGLRHHSTLFTCGQFHGFVGSLGKITLLAFRGTTNLRNCLTDAETPLMSHPCYPGRVHRGFADAVDHVWPEIQKLLGPTSRTAPLWITGHSLGGAMATLASIRLVNDGYTVRAVYTYGSPRVGNREFRDTYRMDNYRFVNDNDLVPHLPFLWCYKHVGQLKLLDARGNLSEEPSAWKSKKQALARRAKRIQRVHTGRRGTHPDLSDYDWLADHHLARYLTALQRLLPRVPRRIRAVPLVGEPCQPVAVDVRRPGAGGHAVPAPHFHRGSGQAPAIAEAAFIAAFFQQSQR